MNKSKKKHCKKNYSENKHKKKDQQLSVAYFQQRSEEARKILHQKIKMVNYFYSKFDEHIQKPVNENTGRYIDIYIQMLIDEVEMFNITLSEVGRIYINSIFDNGKEQ